MSRNPLWIATIGALTLLSFSGCQQKMARSGRVRPYAPNEFFSNGGAAQHPVAGSVARGHLPDPLTETIPMPITRDLLNRGQQRYQIYCSPCHSAVGDGQGMIVQRGFTAPPSYHIDRLRNAPDAHFFDVITHGYGAMFSYADRVSAPDRWAITAYIRALQKGQHVRYQDLTEKLRHQIDEKEGK